MSYPLPGETITRTLRGVEFGHGRPRDEPAPPEIAEYFRAMQSAWDDVGIAHQEWTADPTPAAWSGFVRASGLYERLYNHLLKTMKKHRDRCFTCNGCRFWLHVESHGCRRETIRIEEV